MRLTGGELGEGGVGGGEGDEPGEQAWMVAWSLWRAWRSASVAWSGSPLRESATAAWKEAMAVVPSSLPVAQLGQPLGVPEGGARLLVEVVAGQGEQGLAGVVGDLVGIEQPPPPFPSPPLGGGRCRGCRAAQAEG